MEFGFRNVTLLKTQLYFPFPPFLYFRASNLGKIDANFSWEIVTSSAVLDHRDSLVLKFIDLCKFKRFMMIQLI